MPTSLIAPEIKAEILAAKTPTLLTEVYTSHGSTIAMMADEYAEEIQAALEAKQIEFDTAD